MSKKDMIYPADIIPCGCGTVNGNIPDAGQKPGCGCDNGVYWMPPPECYPYPPFPPYPFPPHPCPPPEPEPEPKKGSIEAQICKLSKKAAIINKMIDFVENKKKDVIIKTGGVSYNFANIEMDVKDWDSPDGGHSYAGTVLSILQHERALIM